MDSILKTLVMMSAVATAIAWLGWSTKLEISLQSAAIDAMKEVVRENTYIHCQRMGKKPSAKAVSLCKTLDKYVHTVE